MRIAFVDVETTGLDPERDEIIEVCVETWDSDHAGALAGPSYASRFMPRGPCNPEAAKVNGFTPEKWAGAPYFTAEHAEKIAAVLQYTADVRGFLGGAATAFDRAFLMKAFERVRVPFPAVSHRLVDVQSMALPLLLVGRIQGVSLQALQDVFGLGAVEHTAVGDVHNTIKVFEGLAEMLCPALLGAT